MYFFAYALILLTLFVAFAGSIWALLQTYNNLNHTSESLLTKTTRVLENCNLILSGSLIVASMILIYALCSYDFSVVYVANYTDRTLPLFYRLTAFWAGQAGSLLFWALMLAICAVIFQHTKSYASLSSATKVWFWAFFFIIIAFFALMLSAWNNPFITQFPVPSDGNGLNPLLQNPGMILHPPLLFLGYGGFVIPGCLALAQAINKNQSEESWIEVSRPFTMTGWLFLTAGIVLGAWWSYMELGWGGYWAWDPVENASLIPWLVATASLHTMYIQTRNKKLYRTNIFLINLTTISAFFATYLVRGNVVDSLHAFGEGGVGIPLLTFVLGYLALSTFISYLATKPDTKALEGIDSREGFLVLTAWLFIALSLIILFATLSPVISNFINGNTTGLTQSFYNKVCLPLFIALTAMLAVCPWIAWKGGIGDKMKLIAVLVTMLFSMLILWAIGYKEPMSYIAAASALGAIVSMLLKLSQKSTRKYRPSFAAYGVHLGLALLVLGVAFSGPYKQEKEASLGVNESTQVGIFNVKYISSQEGRDQGYDFLESKLEVSKNNQDPQIVLVERRVYDTHGNQAYAEAATLFSMNNEFYATLLGIDAQGKIVLRMSSNPLVNWIWLGGILMCLFPFLGLRKRDRSVTEHDGSVTLHPVKENSC